MARKKCNCGACGSCGTRMAREYIRTLSQAERDALLQIGEEVARRVTSRDYVPPVIIGRDS